jgi:perosamine synthetase
VKYEIPVAEPEIGEEEKRKVTEAVESGWVGSKGPFIEQFERGFSAYINTKHGVATSSGTTALHLALVALGIGKGNKVLVPSLSFIAVANAVTYTGAEPIFIDSHPEYWCIDPSRIEEKIDKQTKAIIIVHLYGHPCKMDEIMEIADTHKLHVVEDCAEAHGAEYEDRKIGSFGIISCFSFYGNKIITTGEGGMCLTNDEELTDKMKILRDHGMTPGKRYWHEIVGFNYRMTNLQAALGVAQLKKIDLLVAKKRQIAFAYRKHLQGLPNVKPAPEMPWAKSVYWLYSVLVEKKHRDKLIEDLERKGIESRPFFYPQHILPPYNHGLRLPTAEDLAARGLNLPSGPRLSEDQIQKIVESMSESLESRKV